LRSALKGRQDGFLLVARAPHAYSSSSSIEALDLGPALRMSTGRVSGKSKPRGEALFEDEDDDEDDYEPEEIREKGWSDAIAEAYVVSADRDGL
jgi:hypothetical protein